MSISNEHIRSNPYGGGRYHKEENCEICSQRCCRRELTVRIINMNIIGKVKIIINVRCAIAGITFIYLIIVLELLLLEMRLQLRALLYLFN